MTATRSTAIVRTVTVQGITLYWNRQPGDIWQCFADITHADGFDKWTQVAEVRKDGRDSRYRTTAGCRYFYEPELDDALAWAEQKAAELIHADDYRGFVVWPEDDPHRCRDRQSFIKGLQSPS